MIKGSHEETGAEMVGEGIRWADGYDGQDPLPHLGTPVPHQLVNR